MLHAKPTVRAGLALINGYLSVIHAQVSVNLDRSLFAEGQMSA